MRTYIPSPADDAPSPRPRYAVRRAYHTAYRGDANFHEKALFVKADVAASCGRALELRVLRAMLPSALSVSPLFSDSVHYEILLFGLIEDAAIFGAVSPPRGGRTKFVLRSRLTLDPKRSGTREPYDSV
jgi:hypothetical protein